MHRSLQRSPKRPRDTDTLRKALPLLAAGLIIALIWLARRTSNRSGGRLMPERSPARPSPRIEPIDARPTPSASSGTPAGEPAAESIPTPVAEATTIPHDEGIAWVRGDGTPSCPPAFPIKGNATSRIYHLPGQASYEVTIPAICFATETVAAEHGYRPRKR